MIEHPNYVHIPDSKTEGLRAYREPAEPHPLQLVFLEEAGERAYVERLRGLLSAGRLDAAAAILEGDLAGFTGRLARLAQATSRAAVAIEGWEDLVPILAEHEGPAITAVTVGLTNEPDLVFDAGSSPEPLLVAALYSDDSYPFSSAAPDSLLAECLSEAPAFAGQEEDVEFYAVTAGLAELNGALIQSKHRYFLRDGRDGVAGRAPGGYVEYILATWLRALRFLEALGEAADRHGLPPGARLVAGTAGLGSDFACLLREATGVSPACAAAPAPVATLTMKKWAPRPDPLAPPEATGGSAIRRLVAEPPAPSPPPSEPPAPEPLETEPVMPRRGFLARLFGRRRDGA